MIEPDEYEVSVGSSTRKATTARPEKETRHCSDMSSSGFSQLSTELQVNDLYPIFYDTRRSTNRFKCLKNEYATIIFKK